MRIIYHAQAKKPIVINDNVVYNFRYHEKIRSKWQKKSSAQKSDAHETKTKIINNTQSLCSRQATSPAPVKNPAAHNLDGITLH